MTLGSPIVTTVDSSGSAAANSEAVRSDRIWSASSQTASNGSDDVVTFEHSHQSGPLNG